MPNNEDCCYFGRGEVYMADTPSQYGWGCSFGYCYGGGEGSFFAGRFMGNISAMNVSVASTVRQVIDPAGIQFSSDCAAITIDNVEFSMNISCQSAQNLALAFAGKSELITSTPDPVVDRAILPNNNNVIEACTFFCFDPAGVDPSSVVVTREDTMTNLVAGTDYEASSIGIKFLTGLTLATNTSLLVSYSYNSTTNTCIEPFVKKIEPVTLTYKGTNLADCTDFTVVFYKALLSPTSVYSLISQDFEDLEISGILLPDTTRPSGASQYFKITRANGS